MSKIKVLFLILFSLFSLGISSVVKADVVPGTNYEIVSDRVVKDMGTNTVYNFYTKELRDIFLEANSKYQTRSYGVSLTRSRYSHSYWDSATSFALTSTAYGGSGGASLTVNAGASFSVPKLPISFNLGHSVTHIVPKYKYGYVVLKARYKVNVYKHEVQYQGTKKWVPAGTVSSVSNVTVWSELVTWK